MWLELSLAAADLLTWTQALCLDAELARCEPAALRDRLLHVAAHLTRSGQSWHLKIDKDWPLGNRAGHGIRQAARRTLARLTAITP